MLDLKYTFVGKCLESEKSQFWYSEETCEVFSKIILGELNRRRKLNDGRVLFISSPTAFKYMMKNKSLPGIDPFSLISPD